jgi:hypothetical protein
MVKRKYTKQGSSFELTEEERELLRIKIHQYGYNQSSLAKEIGVTQWHFNRWVKGSAAMSFLSGREIYEKLGSDPELSFLILPETPSHGYINSISSQWEQLLSTYVNQLIKTYKSLTESRKGAILEDISKMIDTYTKE